MESGEQLENCFEQGATTNSNSSSEEKESRFDAAKAIFRSMATGQSTEDTDLEDSTCQNCKQLEVLLKESQEKREEAESLYKRMAADFDNYRKRVEKERQEYLSFGIQKAAEAMLPALDDLDRALATLQTQVSPEKVIEGIELVSSRILKSMEEVGIKPILSVGEPFNPKYHEPVQQIETTEFPDGAVMQELRRGYMLNDRVVRPALVNVALNHHQAENATPDDPNESQHHKHDRSNKGNSGHKTHKSHDKSDRSE
jgi:molecular chaperone GrpE